MSVVPPKGCETGREHERESKRREERDRETVRKSERGIYEEEKQ